MSRSSITHRAILLVILTGLVPMTESTRALSILPQCRFDPDGYFYVKGGAPKGFEEFDHIQLHSEKSDGPTVESRLAAKNGSVYRLARLGEFRTHSSGAGITFEFTTEIVKGVNYQFSGKFTSICVLAQTERDGENIVTEGRLVKFEKGKEKRAADVELTYSTCLRPQKSRQSTGGSEPEPGTGREVLAIVTKIEPKAYTDHLENGKVLVSDVIRFAVVEPTELKHVTIAAYYQGAPNVQGKRLQVGDHVRFELPSEVLRHGILLGDLKGLRFRE